MWIATFTRYRALNTGIAVLGGFLLGCLFSYMQRPDWSDGPVEALVSLYFGDRRRCRFVSLAGPDSPIQQGDQTRVAGGESGKPP